MEKYTLICDKKQIGKLWSPIAKNPSRTIDVYVRSDKKQLQLAMIDLGAYCVLNNINGDMLKLLVEYGNEFSKRFKGMTPEMIKEFEDYRRFKLFQESKTK